jgi:RNA polymerase sigma-70 factor (ECF subfamily)
MTGTEQPTPRGERDELIPTRWSLLNRLKDLADQQSWQEFFDTYWKLIYGVARKAGLSDAEAQDVVQETIISVAKKIGEFKCDPLAGSFKSWLLNLTRWRILNQLKKRMPAGVQSLVTSAARMEDGARTATVERVADPAGLDLDAVWDEEWEKNLAEAAIERVKRQVKAKQFQMFELYVLQQWPVRDVARMLSVSVAQIYLAKHRIGRLIKEELKRLQTNECQVKSKPTTGP